MHRGGESGKTGFYFGKKRRYYEKETVTDSGCTLRSLSGGRHHCAAADNSAIHSGVYVDGIDLSGMTRTEALDALNSYVDEMGEETLTLHIGDND